MRLGFNYPICTIFDDSLDLTHVYNYNPRILFRILNRSRFSDVHFIFLDLKCLVPSIADEVRHNITGYPNYVVSHTTMNRDIWSQVHKQFWQLRLPFYAIQEAIDKPC